MPPARAGRRTSWLAWLPPALWALLVLILSTRPEAFFGPAPTTRDARVVHLYLEILVHFVEFSVFFLLMLVPLRQRAWSRAATLGVAYLAVLALSLTNESLQAFTPTRTFDPWDMAVDAVAGALAAAGTLAAGLVPRRSGRAGPREPRPARARKPGGLRDPMRAGDRGPGSAPSR